MFDEPLINLIQQLINALSTGAVYALFALGFTLVFGVLGVVNLSHGAVFMLGAYVSLNLVAILGVPIYLAIPLGCIAAGLVGMLIDTSVLKPLRQRQAPHLVPMIATIGVGIIINNLVQVFFGAENIRFPKDTIPEEAITIAGVHTTMISLSIILLAFVLMAILLFIMRKTQVGRALRAIAESPKAAALLGVNVERLFLMTSFSAAALGGLAGVLIALSYNSVSPLMGQPILHKGIAVIILGGMGDIRGAMLAGLFLGFAEVLAVVYIGSDMRDAIGFGLLFLILLFRPQGLFGKVLERKA